MRIRKMSSLGDLSRETPKKNYHIIRVNSHIEEHFYNKKELTFKEVYPKINATTIEIIRLGPTMEMWIDENGRLTDKKYNKIATELVKMYGLSILAPNLGVVGDVVIVKNNKSIKD